jgi:two-component system, chemotaxis family, sensor kinase CheA
VNERKALGWERRAIAAEKTVEVLKDKVRALYAGDSVSTIQHQLDRSMRRQEEARRRRDLMGVRAAELARYNQSLEREVRERTRDLRSILDNVTSGFLIVGPDLVVHPGYTNSCHALLDSAEVAGCSVATLLRLDGPDAAHLELAFDQVFSEVLPDEVSLGLIPDRCTIGERTVQLDARPIHHDGLLVAVLLTINDATELEHAQRLAATNHVLIGILRQRSAFQLFLLDARAVFAAAREAAATNDHVYVRRALHTVKGNAAAFDLDEVVNAMHDAESLESIGRAELDAAEGVLRAFVTSHETVLAMSYELLEEESYDVSGGTLDALECAAREEDMSEVSRWTASVVLKRADVVAGPLAVYVEKLAERLEKSVDFRLVGGEQLVDARAMRPVFRNLSHLLRNAVDHGIEAPGSREGKAARASLEVSIVAQGSDWVVAVEDDGRGIDPERIAALAVEKGFVDAESVRAMTIDDKARLVFIDAFSTATEATDVSGRGMGMSAVKVAVEELGGSVAVESTPGRGTRIVLVVPKAPALPRGREKPAAPDSEVRMIAGAPAPAASR